MPRLAIAMLVAALAVTATAAVAPPRRALLQSGLADALNAVTGGGAKPAAPPAPGGGTAVLAATPTATPTVTPTSGGGTTPPPTKGPPAPPPSKEAVPAPPPSNGGGTAPPPFKQAASAPSPSNGGGAPSPSPSKGGAPAPSPTKGGAPAPSPTNAPAPSPSNGGAPAPAPASAAPAPSPGKAPDGGDNPAPPPGKPPGPPPKDLTVGPEGKVADDGKGGGLLPSDKAAADDTRGAKAIQPTALGIKAAGEPQKDISGKGVLTGTPIEVGSARSQGGARATSTVSFAGDLNSASNDQPKPQLTNAPAYGGSGPSGGTYGITWLNAPVYTIHRRERGDWGWGFGSSELVTVVLDNWEARVNNWLSFNPTFKAPAVGYTFGWPRYEYLWVSVGTKRGVEFVWVTI